MDNTKKKKDYTTQSKKIGQVQDPPIAFASFGPATANTENQPPAEPSKAEILYFDILLALHGQGKNESTIEPCKWKMPPHVKKADCVPVPCPPPVVIE